MGLQRGAKKKADRKNGKGQNSPVFSAFQRPDERAKGKGKKEEGSDYIRANTLFRQTRGGAIRETRRKSPCAEMADKTAHRNHQLNIHAGGKKGGGASKKEREYSEPKGTREEKAGETGEIVSSNSRRSKYKERNTQQGEKSTARDKLAFEKRKGDRVSRGLLL